MSDSPSFLVALDEHPPVHAMKTRFILNALLPFLFLTACLLSVPASGAIIEGARESELNFNILVGIGDASDDFTYAATGAGELSYENPGLLLEATTDRGFVLANADLSISTLNSFNRQTSTITGLDFVSFGGYAATVIALEGQGFYLETEGYSGLFQSLNPGLRSTSEFTVTGGPEVASVSVALVSEANGGDLEQLKIQENVDGTWTNVAVYASSDPYTFYDENLVLDPGDYRILMEVPTAGAAEDNGNIEINERIDYEVTFGSPPLDYQFPEEEDFTSPAIYTEMEDSDKLAMVTPAIVSEVDLGDGQTALTYTANLVNSSGCPWLLTRIRLQEAAMNDFEAEPQDEGVVFNRIEPFSTAAPLSATVIHVPNAQVAAVRAGLLDGSLLSTFGRQLIVFRYPVRLIDEGVVEKQRDGSTSLHFYDPILSVGEIYLEWEPYYEVPARDVTDVAGDTRWVQNFDENMPALITGQTLNQGTVNTSPYYSYSTKELSLIELVKCGTVRHSIKNPRPGYARNATEGDETERQNFFPTPVSLALNRLTFDDILKVSGDFSFIPAQFDVEFEIDESGVTDFFIRSRYGAEVNLLVETANHEEVGGVPTVDEQKTLFQADLFSVALPMGFQLGAELEVGAGALANVTRSLSVPFLSRYVVDVSVGIKDGQPYYEDRTRIIPLKVSDPSVFEKIGADLEVWLDSNIGFKLTFPDQITQSTVKAGGRVKGRFDLKPLADPWWSVAVDYITTAGFELEYAGFFSLLDEEVEIGRHEALRLDAGGPLVGGPSPKSIPVPESGLNPGIAPLGDPEQRWARTLQGTNRTTRSTDVFLTQLVNNGDFLTGHSSLFGNRIFRIAKDGRLLRSLESLSHTFHTIDAVALADGGALLLGKATGKLQLIRLDAELAPVWQQAFDLGTLTYKSLKLVASHDRIYVLGKDFFGNPGREQTVISCFDLEGTAIWSRSYQIEPTETLLAGDFTLSAEGDLLLAATTSADFTSEDGLAEGFLLTSLTNNGVVAKLDAVTGDVIWANMAAHRYIPSYNAIAESPTGEITVGGLNSVTFPRTDPTLMLVQFGADGTLLDSLLVGFGGSSRAAGNPDLADFYGGLPHGGETFYDEIHDLVWTDEGLWACGSMGIYNPASVVSTGSSAFTLQFDENLYPTRYAIHGGLSQDGFDRLLITEKGPLATGLTSSFFPWPKGAGTEADVTPTAQWLVKLPWEGKMDFHLASAAAQPDPDDLAPEAGSFYILPRVMAGSLTDTFDINQPDRDTYRDGEDRISDATRTLTAVDLTLTPATLDISFGEAPIEALAAVEYLPASLIQDQASYLQWHQQSGTSDNDGDGLNANAEFFLGTDIATADAARIELMATNPPMLRVPRHKLAAPALPPVLESRDLTGWDPIVPDAVDTLPLDDNRDWLQLALPTNLDPPDQQFYRLLLGGE